MKKIILFTPKVSATNLGDSIIYNSCMKVINEIYPDSFMIDVSTHMDIGRRWMKKFKDVDKKFVLGSNILGFGFPKAIGNWAINPFSIPYVKESVLMGVGWNKYNKSFSIYEKYMYKKVLDNQYLHSVRDTYTQDRLRMVGIESINTGCPTMWGLTAQHCGKIPAVKSENVIATITDYNRVPKRDLHMLNILMKNYNQVFLWIQGYNDYQYLKELNITTKVKIISPSVEAFIDTLKNYDCDYVGTRLHAGITALQYFRRSLIIAIDNRAIEKGKDFNLPILIDNNILELESKINSVYSTNINIPSDNIQKWVDQFKEQNLI